MARETDILVGMKAITQALRGVSEPTVLKWHREAGLPIRKRGGIWIGSRSAIERWWKKEFAG